MLSLDERALRNRVVEAVHHVFDARGIELFDWADIDSKSPVSGMEPVLYVYAMDALIQCEGFDGWLMGPTGILASNSINRFSEIGAAETVKVFQFILDACPADVLSKDQAVREAALLSVIDQDNYDTPLDRKLDEALDRYMEVRSELLSKACRRLDELGL
jgi:hypothetical protein